ncbi:Gfo/Idh/MocA family oxidoreductase [Amycolatopsis acidiphila]|uniref:Gfo/Idh/MocA family oxidoreductase n=1 Tax=Amycolatopsis acidiphila TaxID=715473 RepID=A0A558A2I9_9PSEU|nr:Gfo/Idh/MocA family oxidoreductase [Amycolatopsis acidiphila]TVT18474.1 Gfo/Idh/MocA family oxidoreductase [Amycolatopsis acidiphila]UIJ60013.1 Gfo/Idh/MocA family oxidoreductase [Amycolatopsis acidiphila]GHG61873.1 dehydrogenase [Amycolatopsis acidiphila]
MDDQLRVGLVGAGPWASKVHAPGLADHPGTTLSTVWARRPEAARELAEAHGASVSESVEELLGQVDAVAFAVPPAVQAELAIEAVRAGKHVILEKPIAPDVESAERLTDAVLTAEVASLVMFTLRYAVETREWLDDLAAVGGWAGGGVRWLSGALLAGPYSASAWRHEEGALADVGPHVVDLLDAALGPITEVVSAHRSPEDLWHLVFAHEGGASSTATMSMRLAVEPTVAEIAVYGAHGYRVLNRRPVAGVERYIALLDDFAAMIATDTTTHPCDVRRGLHVQRILAQGRRAAAG